MRRVILVILAAAMSPAALAQQASDSTGPAASSSAAPAKVAPATATQAATAPATPGPASPAASAPPRQAPRPALVAIDQLDLGTTSITGNQELPKVLYIVPWKRSDLGDLVGRPVNSLLDEVLAPVDPEVFKRSLSYYETLHGESQEE
jgi:hypothetical protein